MSRYQIRGVDISPLRSEVPLIRYPRSVPKTYLARSHSHLGSIRERFQPVGKSSQFADDSALEKKCNAAARNETSRLVFTIYVSIVLESYGAQNHRIKVDYVVRGVLEVQSPKRRPCLPSSLFLEP